MSVKRAHIQHYRTAKARAPLYTPIPSPYYPRAPITEAVIELRINGTLETRILEKIARKLRKRYSHQAPLHHVEFMLDMTGGNSAVQQQANGFRLSTDDQADIALVSQNALTTARLSPYPGWDQFCEAARGNWNDWCELAPAYPLVRIGVRYINRIDIPIGSQLLIRLEDYLTIFPRTELLERPLSGFTVQASMETFLPHWIATITTAPFFPPPVPGHFSVMLDIDVARTTEMPSKSEVLWSVMEEARIIKNDLFERTLSPAAKELFRS